MLLTHQILDYVDASLVAVPQSQRPDGCFSYSHESRWPTTSRWRSDDVGPFVVAQLFGAIASAVAGDGVVGHVDRVWREATTVEWGRQQLWWRRGLQSPRAQRATPPPVHPQAPTKNSAKNFQWRVFKGRAYKVHPLLSEYSLLSEYLQPRVLCVV